VVLPIGTWLIVLAMAAVVLAVREMRRDVADRELSAAPGIVEALR
jgi:hypothetical protein